MTDIDAPAEHAHPPASFVQATTRAGHVRGFWRGTPGEPGASAAFLGIPFAEPPVGALRFAAPVPKAPWEGVRDAIEFGASAQRGDPGVTLIPEPSVPGESTLNVNVFTPSPDASGLPVLVWIHGGGYIGGSPASEWYDGRQFNRDGIVTVTISYRLGFDGFGVITDAPSNRGVRDWLLALEWVQRNIRAFGGDPQRVTIAGQSAGGGAVLTLLGMECAQNLFSAAYCMSAATADVTPERAAALSREIAEAGGVAPSRSGFGSLSEQTILELQAKATAFDTLDAMRDVLTNGLRIGPAIDGELITRPTIESLAAGVGADKPLVLGATDDEFAMALAGAPAILRFVPKSLLLRNLSLARHVVKSYLAANRAVSALGNARLLGRFVSDRMFKVPMLGAVAARGDAPTWLYRFAWPSGRFGFAEHCLDVPFFFDCLDAVAIEPLAGDNPPQALADEVHAAAVAFVTSGNPGWPRNGTQTTPIDERVVRVWNTPSSDEAGAFASVDALL